MTAVGAKRPSKHRLRQVRDALPPKLLKRFALKWTIWKLNDAFAVQVIYTATNWESSLIVSTQGRRHFCYRPYGFTGASQ